MSLNEHNQRGTAREKPTVTGQQDSQVCEFRQVVNCQLLTTPAGAQEHGQDSQRHKVSAAPGPMEVGSLEQDEQPAKESEGEASGEQERGENGGIPKLQTERKDFKNKLVNGAEYYQLGRQNREDGYASLLKMWC